MQSLVTPKRDPWSRNHLIRDAIGQAIYDRMVSDPSVHLFGEGCHVKVHYDAPNIERDFSDRVHTLPISEDGNVNFAVGASLLGVKPVVDVITADFLYRAMDAICNTAAKANFVRPDQPPGTIVIRAEFLTGGPTTGQRPEALFTHIPGLNVVIPSTPRDAYGLMRTALDTPGVTLCFEDRMIEDGLIEEHDRRCYAPIAMGYAHERRHGDLKPDVTVVVYGLMRQVVEKALDPMLNIDLLDLRTIYPIDWVQIKASVRRSRRLLIIEPDVQYGGVGAEIAATVVEEMPWVQVKRLGGPRATIPAAMHLHGQMMPTEEQIRDAVENWYPNPNRDDAFSSSGGRSSSGALP